jgi:hypothetical protein
MYKKGNGKTGRDIMRRRGQIAVSRLLFSLTTGAALPLPDLSFFGEKLA